MRKYQLKEREVTGFICEVRAEELFCLPSSVTLEQKERAYPVHLLSAIHLFLSVSFVSLFSVSVIHTCIPSHSHGLAMSGMEYKHTMQCILYASFFVDQHAMNFSSGNTWPHYTVNCNSLPDSHILS